MTSRQTRSKAAQAREVQTPSNDDAPRDVVMNGNGSAHHVPEASDSTIDENIFLFWPNIIGIYPLELQRVFVLEKANLMMLSRLLPNRPRHRVSLLHAPPPSHMFVSLQRLLPPRCPRWLCRAIL